MKKLVFLCLALLVVPTSAAFANNQGLDLTWDNCSVADPTEAPFAPNKSFVCTGTLTRTYRLHATYVSNLAISDFFAMDISIDLQSEPPGSPLPAFYQYEVGGCAAAAISFSVDKTTTGPLGDGAACGLIGTEWGDLGQDAGFANFVSIAPEFSGAGRRLNASIARASTSPIPLAANTPYYGFHLRFTQSNTTRTNCAGCATPAVMVWNKAVLYGVSGTAHEILIGNTGKEIGRAHV